MAKKSNVTTKQTKATQPRERKSSVAQVQSVSKSNSNTTTPRKNSLPQIQRNVLKRAPVHRSNNITVEKPQPKRAQKTTNLSLANNNNNNTNTNTITNTKGNKVSKELHNKQAYKYHTENVETLNVDEMVNRMLEEEEVHKRVIANKELCYMSVATALLSVGDGIRRSMKPVSLAMQAHRKGFKAQVQYDV